MMQSKWLTPVPVVIMLIFSAVIYNQLPEQVPIHWNIHGEVDRTAPRLIAIALTPGLALMIWLVFSGLRRIDPKRDALREFEGTYRNILNLTLLFILFVHIITLGFAAGWDISIPRLIMFGVAMLFALMGNLLSRIRPNWFIGIRTPWTMSDPEVWRKTHRVGGRMMFIVGLVVMVLTLMLPMELATGALLVGAIGFAVFSYVYSYYVWVQRGKPTE